MCYDGFTLKMYLFKSKRFEDGRCTYKNTESSHLIYHPKEVQGRSEASSRSNVWGTIPGA